MEECGRVKPDHIETDPSDKFQSCRLTRKVSKVRSSGASAQIHLPDTELGVLFDIAEDIFPEDVHLRRSSCH